MISIKTFILRMCVTRLLSEIKAFLHNIPSLPKMHLTDSLVSPITGTKVESAIKKLRMGKAPGSDGLMADFYKFFSDEISDNLMCIFNAIFDAKELSSL